MDLRLSIAGENDQELVARMSRDLLVVMRDEVDADAALDTKAAAAGERADVVTLGAIILAVITTGALTKFLEVLNSWVTRKPHIAYKVKRADGAELEINAEFCSSKSMDRQTAICRSFLGL
jgi:hypothetical protein